MEVKNFSEETLAAEKKGSGSRPKDKTEPTPTNAAQVMQDVMAAAGKSGDAPSFDGEDAVIVRTMNKDLEAARKQSEQQSSSPSQKETGKKKPKNIKTEKEETKESPMKEVDLRKKDKKKAKKPKEPKKPKNEKQSKKKDVEGKDEKHVASVLEEKHNEKTGEAVTGSARGIKVLLVLMTVVVLAIAGGFLWYQIYVIEDAVPAIPVASESVDTTFIPDLAPLPVIEPEDTVPSRPALASHPDPFFADAGVFDIDLPGLSFPIVTDMFSALNDLELQNGVSELFVTVKGTPITFFDLLEGIDIPVDPQFVHSFDEVHLFVIPEVAGPRLAALGTVANEQVLGRTLDELSREQDLLSDRIALMLGTVKTEITFTEGEYNNAFLVFQNYEMKDTSFDYAWFPDQTYLMFGTSKDSTFSLIDAVGELIEGNANEDIGLPLPVPGESVQN